MNSQNNTYFYKNYRLYTLLIVLICIGTLALLIIIDPISSLFLSDVEHIDPRDKLLINITFTVSLLLVFINPNFIGIRHFWIVKFSTDFLTISTLFKKKIIRMDELMKVYPIYSFYPSFNIDGLVLLINDHSKWYLPFKYYYQRRTQALEETIKIINLLPKKVFVYYNLNNNSRLTNQYNLSSILESIIVISLIASIYIFVHNYYLLSLLLVFFGFVAGVNILFDLLSDVNRNKYINLKTENKSTLSKLEKHFIDNILKQISKNKYNL